MDFARTAQNPEIPTLLKNKIENIKLNLKTKYI
jgi:hypothetical protein